ncbi:hypothetical protein AMTRI_Chr03g142210 [Amborella trichopoda]
MPMFQRPLLCLNNVYIILFLIPFVASSSTPVKHNSTSHSTMHNVHHKLNQRVEFQITLHGFLLWASMGFLTPVGILLIRVSQKEQCGRRLKLLFYIHLILQISSVLLVSASAVMSIKSFENVFNNTHQRLGLGLYGVMWLQMIIGFCRPQRGVKGRSMWYFVHWLLGTGAAILGLINIYTGLHAYHEKTSKSINLWSILFTAEVGSVVFLYLFQDRWEHLLKQGVILGVEPVTPSEQITDPPNNPKDQNLSC